MAVVAAVRAATVEIAGIVRVNHKRAATAAAIAIATAARHAMPLSAVKLKKAAAGPGPGNRGASQARSRVTDGGRAIATIVRGPTAIGMKPSALARAERRIRKTPIAARRRSLPAPRLTLARRWSMAISKRD
jgi:hypothetical protein